MLWAARSSRMLRIRMNFAHVQDLSIIPTNLLLFYEIRVWNDLCILFSLCSVY